MPATGACTNNMPAKKPVQQSGLKRKISNRAGKSGGL